MTARLPIATYGYETTPESYRPCPFFHLYAVLQWPHAWSSKKLFDFSLPATSRLSVVLWDATCKLAKSFLNSPPSDMISGHRLILPTSCLKIPSSHLTNASGACPTSQVSASQFLPSAFPLCNKSVIPPASYNTGLATCHLASRSMSRTSGFGPQSPVLVSYHCTTTRKPPCPIANTYSSTLTPDLCI